MRQAIRTIVSVAACLAAMTPAPAALRVLATTPDWAALTTELGDRFTVVKVRDELAPGDYRDPGWYQAPARTVAGGVSTEPDLGAPIRRRPFARRPSIAGRSRHRGLEP